MKYVCILSNKGGVGKSTIAAGLALALSEAGYNVGLVDCDITNPSIPNILRIKEGFKPAPDRIDAISVSNKFHVASVTFMLPNKDLPIIWDGVTSGRFVLQLLKSINWKGAEVFILDTPPGVHDETIEVVEALPSPGAVIITTPHDLAIENVRRTISLCNDKKVKIIGLVENMSKIVCPHCGKEVVNFPSSGEVLAYEMGVSFLGRIPFREKIMEDLRELVKLKEFKRVCRRVILFLQEE